jgi:hypothetical protein
VIADLGLGSARLAGSYCVKTGTWVNDPRTLSSGSICDRALNNCSDR